MTKNQKYDTSYENKIKEADSDVLFNCDPSQYIKRLSCNFFQNSVTKYVDNPNNQLWWGSEEQCRDAKLQISYILRN